MRAEWVPYGRPAAEALRHAVATAKAGEPLAPVTVVVPSNHVGVAARRLLASGELGPVCEGAAGVAAVTFVTVFRLAELVGAARVAATGRRPVSTPVIAAAVRGALAAEPGIFAPVADHPATEMALVATYEELRDVSAGALHRLAASGELAAAVVRLFQATRARLAPEFSDEQDLVSAAIEELGARPTHVRGALGTVVVYLPQRLSLHGAALLRAVASQCDVVVLAGTTGEAKADAEVSRSVGRLTVVPSPPTGSPDNGALSPSTTRVVSASDADEEVRAAVRAIVDAARAGTPLERIAVLYGTHDPYARTVHEQLELAGIAHNGASVVPLTHRVAGRTLLGLLALPSAGFRREDVFAWLSGARLRDRGRPAPVNEWERISRDAGVVAGLEQWDRLLERFAGECEERAGETDADPEVPGWRGDRLRRRAERARQLRAFVLRLGADLSAAAGKPRGWAEHAEWARGHLRQLLDAEYYRARWPLVEQKAFERTEQAVDRLACLEAVEGPVGLDVFARTLEIELDADLGRVGRMGEGVLVGSVRMGVGVDLDLAVVLGLAEGSFPAPVRDDSLLPDDEREVAGGELPLRGEETERQHHELLAVLAGARRHLLCLPRGDLRRSNDRVPSRWVDDVARALGGEDVAHGDALRGGAPWVREIASYADGLRRTDFPATEQEHRLRALLAAGPLAVGHGGPAGVVDDPVLDAGAALVAGRRSRRFTRFDGNLAGLPVPSPVDRVTSATRLEGWATCPFAYFVKEILRVEPVENPEDRLQISPTTLGSLVHQVLETFVAEVVARPEADRPPPGDPWTPADRERLLVIADEVCADYEGRGEVGREIFWQRDRRRTRSELERFLREDDRHRASARTRPVAAELAFGMATGPLPVVVVTLPDGRSVSFRGKADRLDMAADGTLEVLDYKTGRSTKFGRLSEENPDDGGRRLQLVVYALAARLHAGRPESPVHSAYWFTSHKGKFERRGYPVTDAVVERVRETIGTVVAEIERGVFPPYPSKESTNPYVECKYCDPDGQGVVDLLRQLERKRDDPGLGVFFALVEPAGQADGADDQGVGEDADA